jgi:inorganic pyrophosphatase
MMDDGEADDKIICVSTNDPRYDCKADIADVEDHYRSEIAPRIKITRKNML